jgi:hypothetical protein
MAVIFTCPTVKKTIGKKTFTLRMDFNALALAEKVTGRNFIEGLTNLDINSVTALFWACAVQTDDKLTLQEVRLFGYKQLNDVVDACHESWRAVNEIPEEDKRPTDGLEQKTETLSPASVA